MATTPIPNTTFPATRSAINANLAQINADIQAKADAAATATALAGKAATTHTHAIADTTGLQSALDAKASVSHTHNASDINAGTLAPDRLATGSGLQVLRRNAANTANEYATIGVGGGDMLAANNLSDVANAATARTNLGLGTAATQASTAFADASATTAALNLKAPLASPTFTGTPAVPTAAPGTNTTQAASTAFVTAAVAAAPGGGSGAPALNAAWTPATTNFIVEGDSIAAGWGDFSSLPALSGKVNFFNVSVSGSWLGATDGSGSPASGNLFNSSRYAANVRPRRPAANGGTSGITESILLLMIGTNNNYDLALDRLATYVAAAKADGFKVFVCTIYATTGFHASGGPTPYTVQACQWYAQYNRGIVDGTAGADYVIPIDKIIWGIGDPAVASDNLHLTTAGNDRCKALINSVLTSDGSDYNPAAMLTQIATTAGATNGAPVRNDQFGDVPHYARTAQGFRLVTGTFAADYPWDTEISQVLSLVLTAPMSSITPSNHVAGVPYELWIKHNGHAVTWAYPIVFAAGVSTTPSADTAHTDYYRFVAKDAGLVCLEHKTGISLAPPATPGVILSESFLQTGAAAPGVPLHNTPADTVAISGQTWVTPGYGPFSLGVVRKHDANVSANDGDTLYNIGISNNYELEFKMLNGGSNWSQGIVLKAHHNNVAIGDNAGDANAHLLLNLYSAPGSLHIGLLAKGEGLDLNYFGDTASSLGIANDDVLRVTIIDGVFRLYKGASGTPLKTQTVTSALDTYSVVGIKSRGGLSVTDFRVKNLAP